MNQAIAMRDAYNTYISTLSAELFVLRGGRDKGIDNFKKQQAARNYLSETLKPFIGLPAAPSKPIEEEKPLRECTCFSIVGDKAGCTWPACTNNPNWPCHPPVLSNKQTNVPEEIDSQASITTLTDELAKAQEQVSSLQAQLYNLRQEHNHLLELNLELESRLKV